MEEIEKTFQHETKDFNLGIIDLGTNSARLMIASIKQGNMPNIILQAKYMVRLGENSFETKMLQESAIKRSIDVLNAFAQTCKKYNVSLIKAVATAAVRKANNGKEFVQRVHEETGIDLNIISGLEEARLIYLGVSQGLPHTFGNRIFIDIGGGSTELIVGSSSKYNFLDSLSLGCVMLTNRFLSKTKDRVTSSLFSAMQDYVKQASSHAFQSLNDYNIFEIVASSGTAISLYELSQKLDIGVKASQEANVLTLESLKAVSKYICALSAKEKTNLPGISEKRAEVLVAGAAILLTLVQELKLDKLTISNLNLQHGLLVDYINNENLSAEQVKKNIRKHSIECLANDFHYKKNHAEHVVALALMLHDSAVDCGLINYNQQWREYLSYASLVHDIGISISYRQHNEHSYYIITHSELLGFTEEEKEYIALLTYFQNKAPSKKHTQFTALSLEMQNNITTYALFLALAENMERLHRQHIYDAAFLLEEDELVLYAQQFSPSLVEENSVRNLQRSIEKLFKRPVSIHFST